MTLLQGILVFLLMVGPSLVFFVPAAIGERRVSKARRKPQTASVEITALKHTAHQNSLPAGR